MAITCSHQHAGKVNKITNFPAHFISITVTSAASSGIVDNDLNLQNLMNELHSSFFKETICLRDGGRECSRAITLFERRVAVYSDYTCQCIN